MTSVTVLSPHLDDAAFSLFVCLSKWSNLSVKIRVVNFFTISGYGPYADTEDTSSITAIRKAEDRRALCQISCNIEVMDVGLLDAPLRLRIPFPDIFKPESRSLMTEDQISQLTPFMVSVNESDLYIAPLALGGHLDHLLVREAAKRAVSHESLAFYEDLPYATWTSEEELRKILDEIEFTFRHKLSPAVIRAEYSATKKRRIIGEYKSQITPFEADAIVNWCKRFDDGERIWIPQQWTRWNELAST